MSSIIEHTLILVALLSVAVSNFAIGFAGMALAEYRATRSQEPFTSYYKQYIVKTMNEIDQGSLIVTTLLFANAGAALFILFLFNSKKKST